MKFKLFSESLKKQSRRFGCEHENLGSLLLCGLRAIGWLVIALLIWLIMQAPFHMVIGWKLWLTEWAQTVFGYERVVGEGIVTAGIDSTVTLILLYTMRCARALHRTMIWILVGWAVWHLLNAPLPLLGVKPIDYESFYFYTLTATDQNKRLSDGLLAAGLLLKGISKIAGIWLYMILSRYGNRNSIK